MIRITMENGGVIDLELDYDAAPRTVKNFEKLVGEGFYDGLIFHRVIKGFMIQGGDPQGTGMGGSKEKIRGEFSSNGWNNPISHKRGVISMARAMDPNSASSHVVSGMDVVDQIAECKTGFQDRPKTPQRIKTIRIVEA